MKSAERFSDRVGDYIRYRPGYPPQAIDHIVRESDLAALSVVADIGAGTGLSARPFLERGMRVVGVEPSGPMREAAREYLSGFPGFEAVDGTAAGTGLADDSVDLVVAAQAFHWFADETAAAEFRRILRPGGSVALMWNERLLGADAFHRAYERFLVRFGTDYETVRHDRIGLSELDRIFGLEFRRNTFENVQTLDFAGLRGRVLSSSYMPSRENPRFPEMEKNLKRLFAEYAERGKIQILYDTNIFHAKILL